MPATPPLEIPDDLFRDYIEGRTTVANSPAGYTLPNPASAPPCGRAA
jgi:hypothetical protein